MAAGIPESDWKVFRELHSVALQRFCDRILAEAKAEIEGPAKTSHEKYLNLYELLQNRNAEIARAFDDLRRSTTIVQTGMIHSTGLFTGEELRGFSPETPRSIEMSTPIPNRSREQV